jgi:hypothetical protein
MNASLRILLTVLRTVTGLLPRFFARRLTSSHAKEKEKGSEPKSDS